MIRKVHDDETYSEHIPRPSNIDEPYPGINLDAVADEEDLHYEIRRESGLTKGGEGVGNTKIDCLATGRLLDAKKNTMSHGI